MKLKKGLLSVILGMAMLMNLMPMSAMTVKAEEDTYPLWVGGVRVTSANANDITDEGTVSYDSERNTLTLDGAIITGGYDWATGKVAGIYYSGSNPLTIRVVKDSEISVQGTSGLLYGIFTNAPNLTIQGGELTVRSTGNGLTSTWGISTIGHLNIENTQLTVNSGNASSNSYGIQAGQTISVTENTNLNVTAGKGGYSSFGIDCSDINLSGTVTATAGDSNVSCAFSSKPTLEEEYNYLMAGDAAPGVPVNKSTDFHTNKYVHAETITVADLIEGGTYTFPQTTANTEDEAKTELVNQINARLSALEPKFEIEEDNITIVASGFTPAQAETSATGDGTNGRVTFTVTVGENTTEEITTEEITTEEITATITHTSFSGTTGDQAGATAKPEATVSAPTEADAQVVAVAKTTAEAVIYADVKQGTAYDSEAELNAYIKGLVTAAVNNSDVTVTVAGTYVAATAGTYENQEGTNGSYTFASILAKGNESQTTTSKSIAIMATPFKTYPVKEGGANTVTVEKGKDLQVTIDADIKDFEELMLRGRNAKVAREHYTAVSGSVILTLKEAYINTLSVGKHTYDAVFTDGVASFTIDVKAESSEEISDTTEVQEPSTTTPQPTVEPSTTEEVKVDNTANIGLWIALALLCVVAGGVVFVCLKKKAIKKEDNIE